LAGFQPQPGILIIGSKNESRVAQATLFVWGATHANAFDLAFVRSGPDPWLDAFMAANAAFAAGNAAFVVASMAFAS
jgi:hypothetical protein